MPHPAHIFLSLSSSSVRLNDLPHRCIVYNRRWISSFSFNNCPIVREIWLNKDGKLKCFSDGNLIISSVAKIGCSCDLFGSNRKSFATERAVFNASCDSALSSLCSTTVNLRPDSSGLIFICQAKNGHPWIFSSEIDFDRLKGSKLGDVVAVEDEIGERVGFGLLNRQSSVPVRMLHFNKCPMAFTGIEYKFNNNLNFKHRDSSGGFIGGTGQEKMGCSDRNHNFGEKENCFVENIIRNRFHASIGRRIHVKCLSTGTQGRSTPWRAVDGESDGIPGVEVDCFGHVPYPLSSKHNSLTPQAAVLRLNSQSVFQFIGVFKELIIKYLQSKILSVQILNSKKEKMAQAGAEYKMELFVFDPITKQYTHLPEDVSLPCIEFALDSESGRTDATFEADYSATGGCDNAVIYTQENGLLLPNHLLLPPLSVSGTLLNKCATNSLEQLIRVSCSKKRLLAINDCPTSLALKCLKSKNFSEDGLKEAEQFNGTENAMEKQNALLNEYNLGECEVPCVSSIMLMESSKHLHKINEQTVAMNKLQNVVVCVYREGVYEGLKSLVDAQCRFGCICMHFRPSIRYRFTEKEGAFGRWFKPSRKGFQQRIHLCLKLLEIAQFSSRSNEYSPMHSNLFCINALLPVADGVSWAVGQVQEAGTNLSIQTHLVGWGIAGEDTRNLAIQTDAWRQHWLAFRCTAMNDQTNKSMKT